MLSVEKPFFSYTKDWTTQELYRILHLNRVPPWGRELKAPVTSEAQKTYMLLGLNYSSLFTEAIKWEEIGGAPHFSSPELTLRKSPLSDRLIITGSMGMDQRLFPRKGGGPSFKVNRKTLDHYLHFC